MARDDTSALDDEIARLRGLDLSGLQARWRTMFGRRAPAHLPRHLLLRILAYRVQADVHGDLDRATVLTRGPLGYLLRNRFYIGEVVYRGEICLAQHTPILGRDLFEAVQQKLASQHHGIRQVRGKSGALLMGRLYNDVGTE